MEWITTLLFSAAVLLIVIVICAQLKSGWITTQQRLQSLAGAAILTTLLLVSNLVLSSQEWAERSARLQQFYPGIDAPVITALNKTRITHQAQADLAALFAPLNRQYQKNHPGDYRSFAQFKQQRWLDNSATATQYYTALAITNPAAITADPFLQHLINGFVQLNVLARMMERELLINGDDKEIPIMAMQIETLL